MTQKNKSSRSLKSPGIKSGILWGLLTAPILYAIVFILELANCLLCGLPTMTCGLDGRFREDTLNSLFDCGCSTGAFACIPVWSGRIFGATFLLSLVACVIIGIIYDIATHKQRKQQIEKIRSEEEWLKKLNELANKGNPQAQFELGQHYHADSGDDDSFNEALKWFEKAAEQGHREADRMKSEIKNKIEYKIQAEKEERINETTKFIESLRRTQPQIFNP